MSAEQTPSVGRVVHYVAHGTPVRPDGSQAYEKRCRAAVITDVRPLVSGGVDLDVALCVLNPTGMFFHEACDYDDGGPGPEAAGDTAPRTGPALCDGRQHDGGTWHWPARV